MHVASHLTGSLQPVVVLGEVLWDLFENCRRLGGAPLNFGVDAHRLGHPVTLISAVGTDELGMQAAEQIAALDLDTRLLKKTSRFPTGTATVGLGPDGKTHFTIPRPAAYDDVSLSEAEIASLLSFPSAGGDQPAWMYFGTLFAATAQGKQLVKNLISTLGESRQLTTFYDLNLRPASDPPNLVLELLQYASVVKLNEEELYRVHEFSGLSPDVEAFCHEGTDRFGWKAVAVTLGARGCALLADGTYVEAAGHPVDVMDPVGAGDAFAAAFLHGLSLNWPAYEIATFANRVGALVASRQGAIPDWTLEEAMS